MSKEEPVITVYHKILDIERRLTALENSKIDEEKIVESIVSKVLETLRKQSTDKEKLDYMV